VNRTITVLIVSLSVVAIVGLGFWFMRSMLGTLRLPEIILTLLLIAGVIALLFALAGLLAVLRTFGLATPNEALGLPPGSIRAVLALMLVLIFAIMSIFLFYQVKSGGTSSNAIGQEQIDLLPAGRILAINAASPGPSGEPRFNVVVAGSTDSVALAQQLVTLLGTLVTAIASFYFGSSAVAAAVRARDLGPTQEPDADPKVARAAAEAARAAAESQSARAARFENLADALEAAEKTTAGAQAVGRSDEERAATARNIAALKKAASEHPKPKLKGDEGDQPE
jgi:hypothetical protein